MCRFFRTIAEALPDRIILKQPRAMQAPVLPDRIIMKQPRAMQDAGDAAVR
jgi:hypothetical protein